MANWKYKIDISKSFQDDDMDIIEKGRQASKVIRAFMKKHKLHDHILSKIAYRFSKISTIDDYDKVLNDLYDWGDIELPPFTYPKNRMAWINTTEF